MPIIGISVLQIIGICRFGKKYLSVALYCIEKVQKTVREDKAARQQKPIKTLLLILCREDEKGGRVWDGHDLVEGVDRGLPLDIILLKLPLVI